jgi:hypothetical protein
VYACLGELLRMKVSWTGGRPLRKAIEIAPEYDAYGDRESR